MEILGEIIKAKLADKGLKREDCTIETVCFEITSESVPVNIGNAFIILLNKELLVPNSANIIIRSADNILNTDAIDFRHLDLERHHFFEKDIHVYSRNCKQRVDVAGGKTIVFASYKLEFLKVTPLYK